MDRIGFAFLFARKGSKGLPRKNIRLLGGRPLIEWTLDYLCQSAVVDKVCISTDDDCILGMYNSSYNPKIIPYKRPAYLGGDNITTEEVLVDACNAMETHIQERHIGVYMQVTEPFRPVKILEECMAKYEVGDHDCVFAATKYHKNFWMDTEIGLRRVSNDEDFNLPRQKKLPVVREDTGICLVADINLFAQGLRIGKNPGYVFYDHVGSFIDIHTEADLSFAENILKFSDL